MFFNSFKYNEFRVDVLIIYCYLKKTYMLNFEDTTISIDSRNIWSLEQPKTHLSWGLCNQFSWQSLNLFSVLSSVVWILTKNLILCDFEFNFNIISRSSVSDSGSDFSSCADLFSSEPLLEFKCVIYLKHRCLIACEW